MSCKIYLYSGENPQKILPDAEPREICHIEESSGISPADLLGRQYDAICMEPADFVHFFPHLKFLDWKISRLGFADSLVLGREGGYKPHNSTAEAVVRVLGHHRDRINSQLPVIVVGDMAFVMTVAVRLATGGFYKIVVAPLDEPTERHSEIREKLRSFIFDLNLEVVSPGELTTLDYAAFLLISNFTRETNKEVYELMTYFNFLSPGATLIDCKSMQDGNLSEEARKAEIFVIEQSEVLKAKYDYLVETIKNSPLV